MRLAFSAPEVWSEARGFAVLGSGRALPGEPLSTELLLERLAAQFGVDVRRSAHRIAARLGIGFRHLSRALTARFEGTREGEGNADLAAAAVRAALGQAGVSVRDLRYLIAHTATPGEHVPPNVVQIARLLGYRGPVADLRQACTGFANALALAHAVMAGAGAGPVAVVGSETGSVYFDPLSARNDRAQQVSLVQMGDGAAAVILAPDDIAATARLSHLFYGQSPSDLPPGLRLVGGGSSAPGVYLPQFAHNIEAIRAHGPNLLACGAVAARRLGVEPREVDYILPHQANGKMARVVAPLLGVLPERVYVNAHRVGNTGSAAIWLALADLRPSLLPRQTVLVLGAEATGYMFGGFRYVHA
jgi:3-oxoacyl-[acyl-carrier-protein] synthase-3